MSHGVALRRAPRRTVKYVCGALGRAPCIHARLRLLATKPREKCGLIEKLMEGVLKKPALAIGFENNS